MDYDREIVSVDKLEKYEIERAINSVLLFFLPACTL